MAGIPLTKDPKKGIKHQSFTPFSTKLSFFTLMRGHPVLPYVLGHFGTQ